MPRIGFSKRLAFLSAALCFLGAVGWTSTAIYAQGCHGGGGGHGSHGSGNDHSQHGSRGSHSGCHEVYDNTGTSIADRPPHGGQISSTTMFYFEVVYLPQETHVFVYGAAQEPLSSQDVRGEVVMQPHGSKQVFRFPLKFVALPAGVEQNHLATAADVSRVRDGEMTVTFKLENLPSRHEPKATFSQTFALTRPPLQVSVVALTDADRAGVERQQVCPITRARLGSMGTPVKVLVGESPLFLCCMGCLSKVQEKPQAYLPAVPAGASSHTKNSALGQILVSEATVADQAAIQNQRQCPVSGTPLGQRGVPIKLVINDQVLFVCCQGCIPKISENPTAFLAHSAPLSGGR